MKTPTFLMSAAALTITAAINVAPAEAAPGGCPSGYVCVWSGKNYSGTIRKYAATGAYKTIDLKTTESYYNNRSKRTWLHATSDGSGTYTCLAPGAQSNNLSGWQSSAKAVYLTTITDC